MQMTETVTGLLATALNDPEEPFTSELDETAASVTGCLSNVLKSASDGSQPNNTSQVTYKFSELLRNWFGGWGRGWLG